MFQYLPGRDWPAGFNQALCVMRGKIPTTTWAKRHNGQLSALSGHQIKEAYFGHQMISLAKETRAYIFKYMNPSYISEEELDSGKQMGDMYHAMLKKILWTADCMLKTTKAVGRMSNVAGNALMYYSIYFNYLFLSFR